MPFEYGLLQTYAGCCTLAEVSAPPREVSRQVPARRTFESYLEDRAWEVANNAIKIWEDTDKTSHTLICLLGFSGLTMDKPPDTLTPKKADKTVKDEKIKIINKTNLALEKGSFNRR